jgi:hypothetical protein
MQLPETLRSDECPYLDARPDVTHGHRAAVSGGLQVGGAPGWLGCCRRHGDLPSRYRRAVDPVLTYAFTIHLAACGGIASSG